MSPPFIGRVDRGIGWGVVVCVVPLKDQHVELPAGGSLRLINRIARSALIRPGELFGGRLASGAPGI